MRFNLIRFSFRFSRSSVVCYFDHHSIKCQFRIMFTMFSHYYPFFWFDVSASAPARVKSREKPINQFWLGMEKKNKAKNETKRKIRYHFPMEENRISYHIPRWKASMIPLTRLSISYYSITIGNPQPRCRLMMEFIGVGEASGKQRHRVWKMMKIIK